MVPYGAASSQILWQLAVAIGSGEIGTVGSLRVGSRRVNLSGALWCCQQPDPMATGSCHRIRRDWNRRINPSGEPWCPMVLPAAGSYGNWQLP